MAVFRVVLDQHFYSKTFVGLCLSNAMYFTVMALKWTIAMIDEGCYGDTQSCRTDGASADLL